MYQCGGGAARVGEAKFITVQFTTDCECIREARTMSSFTPLVVVLLVLAVRAVRGATGDEDVCCPSSDCTLLPGGISLGEAHNAHQLRMARCIHTSGCRTRYFRLPVLTRKSVASQGSEGLQSSHDTQNLQAELEEETPQVPEELRMHWRFGFQDCPVTCECVGRPELLNCIEGYTTLKFGEDYFPHRVNEVKCANTSQCYPLYYRVPVLTRLSVPRAYTTHPEVRGLSEARLLQYETALQVPEELRKDWRFDIKVIAVACEFYS